MKKIDLSKQTLRTLTASETDAVAGAAISAQGHACATQVNCPSQNSCVIGCVIPSVNTPCVTSRNRPLCQE